MEKRSNVNCISNIYILEKDFKEDRNFQARVRGRDNLKAMLTVLSGQSWNKGAVSVDEYIHYLTDLQKKEWKLEMPCALLDDKTEVVWGVTRNGGRDNLECRCTKVNCRHFRECRPDYSGGQSVHKAAQIQPEKITVPELPQPEFLPQIDEADSNINEPIDMVFKEDYTWDDYAPPDNTKLSEQAGELFADRQEAVIKSRPDERLMVLAGPGTGKTHCLIEKLKYMVVDSCSIDAENILLLCFTRAAVKEIKNRLQEEAEKANASDDISRIEIRTFDSFATSLLMAAGCSFEGLDYDTRIEKAIFEIKEDPGIIDELKHFMVDEIQDLVGVRARFVKTILKYAPEDSGFTLLGDHLQGIYDYQVKDMHGEVTADQLLNWTRGEFEKTLQEHTLTSNIRQAGKLAVFTSGLRDMLECEGNKGLARFFDAVKNLPVRGIDYKFPEPTPEEGRTAILCRNNGEVLKLSAQMRMRNINHTVKRRYNSPLLPVWFSMLAYSDSDRITADNIAGLLSDCTCGHPDYPPDRLFHVLQMQTDETGKHLSISRLVSKLAAGNRLPDELYEDKLSSTIISTIHKSKGREYDTVLYYYTNNNRIADDGFDEAKVAYVAITRAKQRLQLLNPGKSYGWLQKVTPEGERWCRCRMRAGGSKSLMAIEVGREGDMDDLSFAAAENGSDIQDYINSNVNTGDSVELKLHNGLYHITHEGRVIGAMSENFTEQLRSGLKTIYGRGMNYMPESMDDIYVNRKYTVARRPETLSSSIYDRYSKGIWSGVSVIGLGKIRWNYD